MSARASIDLVEDLHGVVGETLIAELTRYRTGGVPVPPQLLACCNKFLKANGVDTPSPRMNREVDSLADCLPAFDDFDL